MAFFVSSYEPELHPGVTYKLTQPKATLKIFSTGSVTVTGKFISHCEIGSEGLNNYHN